jgi:hypothetical protein
MLPPAGKHWQWTPEKLDECDAAGDIYWTRNGTPRRRIWADESAGAAVANIWLGHRDPFNQNFAITGYPTEKNLELLKRIVASASEPGDLVLDAYAGSGTTLAAAAELGRRWIGIDSGDMAVALAQRRLAAAAHGFELWGPQPTGGLAHAAADVEFAFVERAGEVRELVDATRVPQRLAALEAGERLVTFDRAGRESVLGQTMRAA